jgi:hypothetical protein
MPLSEFLHQIGILIIKPSSLGDIVHTLPAVAAVRDAYPGAEITWVINPEWSTPCAQPGRGPHPHFPRGEFAARMHPGRLAVAEEDAVVAPGRGARFQGLLRVR